MPEAAPEKIWQVCEITGMIRELLEQSIRPLWVSGEIGNITIHRSGHVYMTVKDAASQLKAVYFSGAAACRALDLRQGSKVEVYGKLSIYQAGGDFQLNVRAVRLCGTGDLQLRFEEVKRRLAAEGIFDEARKKTVPFFCRRIGLVTSPSGAAVRDFLKIAQRRFPGLDIRICPAPVQGKGAENKLAAAIRFFNRVGEADVIVLTRGGGSLEDLWPFNEEILARAIAASRIPVVSAVGHEIDFTIADFAADLRAPTPSAAAEMIVPEKEVIRRDLNQFRVRFGNALGRTLENARHRLERVHGGRLARRFEQVISERRQQIDSEMRDIRTVLSESLSGARARLANARTALDFCSPMNTVRRGYAILMSRGDGSAVTSAADARAEKRLRAVLSDGSVDLDVAD